MEARLKELEKTLGECDRGREVWERHFKNDKTPDIEGVADILTRALMECIKEQEKKEVQANDEALQKRASLDDEYREYIRSLSSERKEDEPCEMSEMVAERDLGLEVPKSRNQEKLLTEVSIISL